LTSFGRNVTMPHHGHSACTSNGFPPFSNPAAPNPGGTTESCVEEVSASPMQRRRGASMRLSGGCQHHPGLPHPGDAPRSFGRYGLVAEDVGVGDVAPEAVGVGVGQGSPSSEFRQPTGGRQDGIGGGDTAGGVAGAPAGGAVVDMVVSGTGSGFGPLGPL